VSFGHGEHTAHCLAHADMVDHGIAKAGSVNNHADHSAPSGSGSQQMTCCGLFCLSAIPAQRMADNLKLAEGYRRTRVRTPLPTKQRPGRLAPGPLPHKSYAAAWKSMPFFVTHSSCA